MDDIAQLFGPSININTGDAFDEFATWPHNVDILISRVPIRKRDGYSYEFMQKMANKIKGSMAPNGVVFLICYAPNEDKARPFEICKAMVEAGLTHVDNIVICKSWLPGKRSDANLVNSHEYVLFFCNGNVWGLDRLPVKEYLKMGESVSCPGNTWTVETGSLEEAYPLDLALLLVKMADQLPGSLLFDPFMGTQSGLLAAVECGHSFNGFEKDTKRVQKYKKLIQGMIKEGRL